MFCGHPSHRHQLGLGVCNVVVGLYNRDDGVSVHENSPRAIGLLGFTTVMMLLGRSIPPCHSVIMTATKLYSDVDVLNIWAFGRISLHALSRKSFSMCLFSGLKEVHLTVAHCGFNVCQSWPSKKWLCFVAESGLKIFA